MKVIVKKINKTVLMLIAATVMTVSSTVAFSQTSGDGNKTRQRFATKGADPNQQDPSARPEKPVKNETGTNAEAVPADATAKDLDSALLADPGAPKKNVDGSV